MKLLNKQRTVVRILIGTLHSMTLRKYLFTAR